ncbi:hypothetical protein [Streptomyces microflavus]|uniref:hypothetical protein n=1 Tax=Streptomyces microflavus TaxID=1919 RepID=UPI003408395A
MAACIGMGGCTVDRDPDRRSEAANICGGEKFIWSISTRWRLTILDEAKTVDAGSKMVADSTPFEPKEAEAKISQGELTSKIVFSELENHLSVKLASPGTSTASEKRIMSALFPEKGQGVYFRGVKQVSGSFALICPGGEERAKGSLFTWQADSSTTGLADCALGPEGNARSELSRMAIAKRCPHGTPARAVLGPESGRAG